MTVRWAHERASRDEDWAIQRSEIESRHVAELNEARERASKRIQEAEAEWKLNLEQARASWVNERSLMEASHADKVEEVREVGEKLRAQLEARHQKDQEEMESKMTGITSKLLELTRRETSRDAARAELSRQFEELQEANAIESQRRSEQESSLRSTLESYRSQLSERTRELDEAQRELRAAKMQSSLAALKTAPPSLPPVPPSLPVVAETLPPASSAKSSSTLPKTSSFSFDDTLEETLAASRAAKRRAEISLSGLLNPQQSTSEVPDTMEGHEMSLALALDHAQALLESSPDSSPPPPFPPSLHPQLVSSFDMKRDLDETRATIARLAAGSLPPSTISALFTTPEKQQPRAQSYHLPPPPSPPLFTPMPAAKVFGAKPPFPPPPPSLPPPDSSFPPPPPSLPPPDSSFFVTFPPSAPNSFRVRENDFDADLRDLRSLREQIQADAYGSSRDQGTHTHTHPALSSAHPDAEVADRVNSALSAIRTKLEKSVGRAASAPHLHPSSIAETAARIEKSAAEVFDRARSPPSKTPLPGSSRPDDSARRQLAQRLDVISKNIDL